MLSFLRGIVLFIGAVFGAVFGLLGRIIMAVVRLLKKIFKL